MPNPSDRPIDYAAIARSAMKPSGQKPAWLVEGQAIYAPSHALGKNASNRTSTSAVVRSLVRKQAIALFIEKY